MVDEFRLYWGDLLRVGVILGHFIFIYERWGDFMFMSGYTGGVYFNS